MQIPAEPQTTDAVLMVRPANFGGNPETAASNSFQRAAPDNVQALALQEFDLLVKALRQAGVTVEVFEDTPRPLRPDAVFPNNWVSFHADGTVVLYPMLAPNRRWERRADIIKTLAEERGYRVARVEDLSAAELDGRFLEGTGSLVLDRVHRVAYACLSPRTDEKLLKNWGRKFGYEILAFRAVDAAGKPVYHTNVMMSVGGDFAVVCADSLPDADERRRVVQRLEQDNHETVLITSAQMADFAGNLLALATRAEDTVLAMSMRAERAFTAAQRRTLERHARIVASPINSIEHCAGGGVRCMLAEIFLPREKGHRAHE